MLPTVVVLHYPVREYVPVRLLEKAVPGLCLAVRGPVSTTVC